MKKGILLAVLLCFLFIGSKPVSASICTYSEQAQLNKDVANIKVIYEEATGILDPSLYDCQADNGDLSECNASYDYFVVSVLNMTEDFYITVRNNIDNTRTTYYYSDAKDGVISFDWEGILNVTTFTIDVFSSSETSCPRENYRTIYFTTPRKNLYYYYGQCQQNPEYYLCQKYVTFDDITFYEFIEKINNHNEEKKEEPKEEAPQTIPQKVIEYITNNSFTIIVVVGAIVIATVLVVTIVKKRKKGIL